MNSNADSEFDLRVGVFYTLLVLTLTVFFRLYRVNASLILAFCRKQCYYNFDILYTALVVKINEVKVMPVNYKKLWILLIERHITKAQLRKSAKLSPATLTKLNKNEYVSMEILTRICGILGCDIGDIVAVALPEDKHD